MVWSPQHYISHGLVEGHDVELLERGVEQIEAVIIPRTELPSLLTLNHLAVRTGTSYRWLRQIIGRHRSESYRHFRVRKRSGGYRTIDVPEPDLMKVQRWISSHILKPLPVHSCSYAFSKNASILKCAARHTGAKWLVKLDVRGFFGSVSEIQAYRVFRKLGYQPLVSFELARISTYAPTQSPRYRRSYWRNLNGDGRMSSYATPRIGYLPQGAPTSPMLSNLVMFNADDKLDALARKHGLRYSRYSDDLTFSTRGQFSRKQANALIWEVTNYLRKMDLHINERKTVVVPPGGRKVVLGLLVDGSQPRLNKAFRDRIRQHLHYLEMLGPKAHAANRGFDSIWGLHRHIKGLIDFAKMVDPPYAQACLLRLRAIDWPANEEL